MATNIGDLRARLGLDGAKFSSGLKQADRGLAGFSRRAEQQASRLDGAFASMTARMTVFGKGFIGGAVAGVAATAFAGLTSNIGSTVKSMAQLGDEAKRAGLSTDAFQEWKFVAEQNRVGVDALVDGFKELALRSDELIATGVGPAAEAFARLGIRSDELKRKLKDPSALMVEILGKLEGFDKAAQIRIADEIFGGTGGEQFVQLLGKGEGALQATIDRAHQTGAVLDAELIAKAEEIDRKFSQLTTSAGNFAKRVAVGIAAAGVEFTDLRTRLDSILTETEGRSIFGDEFYDQMKSNPDLVDQNATAIANLNREYDDLSNQALQMVPALMEAASRMEMIGHADVAGALRDAAGQMDEVIGAFRRGDIEGEQLTERLDEIKTYAGDAFQAMGDVDRQQFGGVMGRLGALSSVIAGVAANARSMALALATAAGTTPGQQQGDAMRKRQSAEKASMDSLNAQREALRGFADAESARNSATKEQLDLEREIEAVKKRASEAGAHLTDQQAAEHAAASLAGNAARNASNTGGGGGGSTGTKGGGAAKLDEYAKEVEGIRDRTSALQSEAAVLIAVAASGKDYGDALEFARKKAELLHAAQQAGKKVTPEMENQIDALADAYVQAGLKAEGAAQKLDAISERSRAGKDALTDMFGSILDRSQSAKEAIGQILAEIAKMQLLRGIFKLPGMGALSSGIGGLLGANANGTANWTGGLTRIHERGGEIVDLPSGSRIYPHDVSMRMAEGAAGSDALSVTVVMDPSTGALGAFVRNEAGQVLASSAPQLIGQSVQATKKSMTKSKRGYGL